MSASVSGAQYGKQAALLTIHGSRLGVSQADSNGNAAVLLDGYALGGLSGVIYESGATGITALAAGGQTSLSSVTINSQVSVIGTVATTSDSVMLPPTAGKIPVGGSISLTIINKSSLAAAIFPSSGDAINALGANASLAIASSGVTGLYCASSGQWYSK